MSAARAASKHCGDATTKAGTRCKRIALRRKLSGDAASW